MRMVLDAEAGIELGDKRLSDGDQSPKTLLVKALAHRRRRFPAGDDLRERRLRAGRETHRRAR
jgi:hypothetical protein